MTEKELKQLHQIAQKVTDFLKEWGVSGTVVVKTLPPGRKSVFWGFGKWEHPAVLVFKTEEGKEAEIEVGAYAHGRVRAYCGHFIEKKLYGKRCRNVRENKPLPLPLEFLAALEAFLVLLVKSGLATSFRRGCSSREGGFRGEIRGCPPDYLCLQLEIDDLSSARLLLNQNPILEGDAASVLKQLKRVLSLSTL